VVARVRDAALLPQAGTVVLPLLRVTMYPSGRTPPMPAVQSTRTLGAAAAGTVTPVGGFSAPVVAVADPDPVALQYARAGVAAAVATIAKIASSTLRMRVLRANADSC
jgi:hypothetical protein